MEEFTGRQTLPGLLKACAKKKDLDRGSKIHAHIVSMGLLEKDIFIGSALVSMYAKCGSLSKAAEVFHSLPVPNIVSWNALISAYAQHGRGEEALNCLQQMRQDGLSPNAVTFVCILKACGIIGAADKGQEIHTEILREGLLETHIIVASALVDMYAKCGLLAKARAVFDKLAFRNAIVWNALITGYVQHRNDEEVLNCFKQMQLDGISPDVVTYVCILKACGGLRNTEKGEEVHAQIVREGLLEKHIGISTVLIGMYAKFGWLSKAQDVFDKLPVRNVVLWSALIAGYTQNGLGQEALNLFEQMQVEGISPNSVTFVCILKACGSICAADKGQAIHAEIMKEGLLDKDVFVGTAIVDMYAKCGLLAHAQEVFDNLSVRDVVSWNALIAGYAQYGHAMEALNFFERMRHEGIPSDASTFVSVLKACGKVGAKDKGQEIHADIVKEGLFENNILIGTALLDMYGKCGLLAKACEVFDKLFERNVVSWNALMTVYAQHGHCEEALNCFDRMKHEGVPLDEVTFVCVLKACGTLGASDRGQEIHNEIAREGWLGKHIVVGNALIDMYGKCGLLAKAQEVFDKLPAQDVVTWSGLIAGYAQHGHGDEALDCFERMQIKGLSPDAVTLVYVLKVCANLGAVDKGQQIHAEGVSEGLLERDVFVANALVDMYAKCGLLAKAQEVFDKLTARNTVLWNALIAGYALDGRVENVFCLLEKMGGEGIKPTSVTFSSVLNACSHTGLLENGQICFESMSTCHSIVPTLEHYTCMVDLFGRAGYFEKAVAVIKQMPYSANLAVWHALLGACRKWGNEELGRLAFEQAMQLDEKDASVFVCMVSICSETFAASKEKASALVD